eukprot:364482-Chlamydomonas_euryale.AAC.5
MAAAERTSSIRRGNAARSASCCSLSNDSGAHLGSGTNTPRRSTAAAVWRQSTDCSAQAAASAAAAMPSDTPPGRMP